MSPLIQPRRKVVGVGSTHHGPPQSPIAIGSTGCDSVQNQQLPLADVPCQSSPAGRGATLPHTQARIQAEGGGHHTHRLERSAPGYSLLLEYFGRDALAQAAYVERILVPLRDAARQRGVIAAFVDPRVAVVSADPHEGLAHHSGQCERLARPGVCRPGTVPCDRLDAGEGLPRVATVAGPQRHVAVAHDEHGERVLDDEVLETPLEAGRRPAVLPRLCLVVAARDAVGRDAVERGVVCRVGAEATQPLQEFWQDDPRPVGPKVPALEHILGVARALELEARRGRADARLVPLQLPGLVHVTVEVPHQPVFAIAAVTIVVVVVVVFFVSLAIFVVVITVAVFLVPRSVTIVVLGVRIAPSLLQRVHDRALGILERPRRRVARQLADVAVLVAVALPDGDIDTRVPAVLEADVHVREAAVAGVHAQVSHERVALAHDRLVGERVPRRPPHGHRGVHEPRRLGTRAELARELRPGNARSVRRDEAGHVLPAARRVRHVVVVHAQDVLRLADAEAPAAFAKVAHAAAVVGCLPGGPVLARVP
eukprot:3059597-Prymnesium_polylepis.2